MFSGLIVIALACALALGAVPRQAGGTSSAEPKPPAQPSAVGDSEVRFDGEVLRGQSFEHDIGHGLVFRLTPAAADEGGGWVIEILPPAAPSDEPVEFSEIATPPYHSYNERYVAAAFGYSSKEAVKVTTRTFNFVQSVADVHIANEVVNAALYPSTVPETEKGRIASEAARLKLGRGELHILRSRITSGKGGDPDTIAWVKFEVTLNFSPGLTLQKVLAPQPAPLR
ncbi:MAG TPA: hypothetical protein VJO53_12260 [Candidatus Acidoferrales bacterium]|nr:hypothetical protein [Candidatus Acidoferrales bacterium]